MRPRWSTCTSFSVYAIYEYLIAANGQTAANLGRWGNSLIKNTSLLSGWTSRVLPNCIKSFMLRQRVYLFAAKICTPFKWLIYYLPLSAKQTPLKYYYRNACNADERHSGKRKFRIRIFRRLNGFDHHLRTWHNAMRGRMHHANDNNCSFFITVWLFARCAWVSSHVLRPGSSAFQSFLVCFLFDFLIHLAARTFLLYLCSFVSIEYLLLE